MLVWTYLGKERGNVSMKSSHAFKKDKRKVKEW